MAALLDMPNLTGRQFLEKIFVKMNMVYKLSEQVFSYTTIIEYLSEYKPQYKQYKLSGPIT